MALIFGIVLLSVGLSMRFAPAIWEGQRWLASDTFSKVGLVLVCMWLAWPAVEAIRKAPGGAMLMIACTMVLGLFVYRPKTIYITGPFIAQGLDAEKPSLGFFFGRIQMRFCKWARCSSDL
jgi:hypothetical protein